MSNTPERIYALERLGQFVARRERMNDTPERIYGWRNTQLSIARHYGGIKYNGEDYRIAYGKEGQPLVRADVLKREKQAKGVKRG